MKARIFLASIFFTICLGVPSYAQQAAQTPAREVKFERYLRTELYMGMSIPGAGMVSDADWEKFLGDVVTPMFPDGFSVLSGRGQYREATGVIAKEPSHVLVFLYPRAKRKDAGAKIESIRNEYEKRFAQESVLRVDISKSVSVSF